MGNITLNTMDNNNIYISDKDEPREYSLKRIIDFLLALGGLVASFPLTIIVSILVYLEDRGPVFYSQKRVGKGGILFNTYKFRTMIEDSDRLFGPLQAIENDPRITKVGKLLRFTALDELPQLWSILKGDMSFVGPRALLPAEKETGDDKNNEMVPANNIKGYEKRILVKPGLTGIAQIFAPRDINRRNKFRYDSIYIDNMGLLFDLKLICISFYITFKGAWEKRESKI